MTRFPGSRFFGGTLMTLRECFFAVQVVVAVLAAVLAGGPLLSEDCNANGVEDSLDLLRGTSEDTAI